MKKKWLLIVLLIIIVFINPKTIGSISKKLDKKSMELKDIKSIEINKDFESVKYDNKFVYYNGKSLKSIDDAGKEIFNIDFDIKNAKIESNKFIDILDKGNNIVYSINKNGKIIFKKNVPKDGLMYLSLDNDSYLYAYKKENKDIVNIYDFEGNLQKSIELEGKITGIEYSPKGIYVCSLNTDKKLSSVINYYDYNGNLKNTKKIDDSIVLDSIMQKDSMYLIEKNKISRVDENLKTLDEFEVKNIKSYSNIDNEGIYIIEEDNKVKYISKGIEEIDVSSNIEYIDGIVNTKDDFIMYKDDKIINAKGEDLKSFEEDIKKITLVNDNTIVVELDSTMHILKIN